MRNIRAKLVAGAAVGAAAVGGAAIASAATSSSPSASTTNSAAGQTAPRSNMPNMSNMPAHGTAAHEDAEKTVTGTVAANAGAAAVKSLGGGTAGAVTTDFAGHGYEVTVTKSDGSKVEVHLDSSFNVMRRPGGPGRPGGSGAPGAPGTYGG